jgi:hypothetical protein
MLKDYGCEIATNSDLNHKQKLDFVVLHLPYNLSYRCPIGVQVTGYPDQGDKMNEFFQINKNSLVVDKVLYMEFDPKVDLENGGGTAALYSIADIAYNRSNQSKVGAVRIFDDLTYEFFNIEERIASLRAAKQQAQQQAQQLLTPTPPMPKPIAVVPAVPKNGNAKSVQIAAAVEQINRVLRGETPPPNPTPGNTLEKVPGIIREYYPYTTDPKKKIRKSLNGVERLTPRSCGYIHDSHGQRVFFHINKVITYTLKDRLNKMTAAQADETGVIRGLNIPVVFHNAGMTKDTATSPEALEVELVQ